MIILQISRFGRSFAHAATFFALLVAGQPALSQSELKPVSTEYTRAQVLDWIDDKIFAVGRWDGSLSIFRVPIDGEFTPVLLQTRVSGGTAGVEMVASIDSLTLLFSDGPDAVGLWIRNPGSTFDRYHRFTHDAALGIANSAAVVHNAGKELVVTGHANGFAEVWERRGYALVSLRTVDLRSPRPIASPYPLKNIRGLATWRKGIVISGSEDGDIVGFTPADGRILYRQRYNPSAQRGINSISLLGDKMLLANCSVGVDDKNLWLYEISETGVSLVDSINLIRDRTLTQSFNFDADLYQKSGSLRYFASTQEGLLWSGNVNSNKLTVEGMGKIGTEGGAILDLNSLGAFLAAAAQDIMLFKPE